MENQFKKTLAGFLLAILTFIDFLPGALAAISTAGPLNPGTSAGAAVGSCTNAVNWGGTGTPGNASANDTSYITITGTAYDNAELTDNLALTNFGFALPENVIITGILVETLGWAPAGSANYTTVQLSTAAGTNVGQNKATGAFNTSDPSSTYTSWGSSTDLWQYSGWNTTRINNSGFGVALCFTATAADTNLNVDHVRITVSFSPPNRTLRLFRRTKMTLFNGKIILYPNPRQ